MVFKTVAVFLWVWVIVFTLPIAIWISWVQALSLKKGKEFSSI